MALMINKTKKETAKNPEVSESLEEKMKRAERVRAKEAEMDKKIKEYYSKQKKIRIIFIIIVSLIIIACLVFGVYGVFFKQERPIEEIVAMSNGLNKTTAFPESGVEGYLKENFKKIAEKKIGLMEGGPTKYGIDSNGLYVTYISKKTAEIANVYFNARITTDENGVIMYSFYIPLKFDWKTYGYQPAGELSITNYKTENDVKIAENNLLTFNKDEKYEGDEESSARTFIDGFLKALYNTDIEINQMYIGKDKIRRIDAKFNAINSFEVYKVKNKAGYNAKVEYSITTKNSLKFSNITYLNMKKQGNTWVIENVL